MCGAQSCAGTASEQLYGPTKVPVQSNGRTVDAAHADAMSLRNKQYQKLLEDHKKLNVTHAKQRELGRHQAGQLHDLQV